jgi:hypothetical protein
MDNTIFKVNSLSPKLIYTIFSRILFDKKTNCWIWTGNKNQTGYGRVRYLGNKVLLHRLMYSWINHVGLSKVISKDNLIIDHICNNKACCNPDHLRLTTHKINVLRSNGPSAIESRQTHCKNGHLLPAKKNSNGRRFCQPCNSIWARNRYRRVHKLTPDKFKVI